MKFFWIVLLFSSIGWAQTDSILTSNLVKTSKEPIIFVDFNFGLSSMKQGNGFHGSAGATYQFQKNIVSFRAAHHMSLNVVAVPYAFLAFVYPYVSQSSNELAFLYGRRHTFNWFSLSYSGGIGYNFSTFRNREYPDDSVRATSQVNYPGFAFAVKVKAFKPEKSPFRVFYGMIPVSSDTGFGRSIGLSLIGNIGEYSYIGGGLSVGFGFHKNYE